MNLRHIFYAAVFAVGSVAGASAQDLNCGNSFEPFGGCVTPAGTSGGSGYSTEVYTGVQFVLGKGSAPTPRLVLGARRLHVDSDDKVYGADLSLRFGINKGVTFDSAAVSLVGGRRDVMANAGIGYSYSSESFLALGAIETAHLRAGAEYVFTLSSPTFFVEVNTLKTPAAAGNGAACGEGFYARDIDTTDPFAGDPEDFFVLDPGLLVGSTTCVPTDFGLGGLD
jgi:hypothetical protein